MLTSTERSDSASVIVACMLLRQIKQGEVFRSDTDTEVIPKLCNYIYNNTPERLPFNEVTHLPASSQCWYAMPAVSDH